MYMYIRPLTVSHPPAEKRNLVTSPVMPRSAFDNPVTFTAGRLDIDGHVHGQRWTV